ncbi:uncharacterized protein LOC122530580 isoform X1 [Frieseomelitta varia]|uniref:uncharacterized protein LOC122530580 isoform X1 n=1 Tax=Frieseomelitta varia TaxID=561572 RepID=UPI001CB690D9|nr:uncharacterized protein LOC122530580 isoform X1 [Frieseomelitta varia]
MSINVTVNGNRLNIRRGRMVLSDLDQIKKNERDRRRRLRLEQVRQQSKEISDRLLKRTKCIAKEELKKLENNDKLSLKQIYNGKIMEVQQKYQEDMADIGQAHISAALEPDHDALIDEQHRKNQLAALKRGKEAMKQIKNTQQKEAAQQQHQERLHLVREMEDLRSTMIANLSKKTVPEEDTICISIQNEIDEGNKQQKATKKKTKKRVSKKSPGKVKTNIKIVENDFKMRSPVKSPVKSPGKSKPKTVEEIPENDSVLEQQSTPNSVIELLPKQTVHTTESEFNSKNSKKETTSIPAKDKTTRYNPNDYVQTTSDSINSDSPNSFSDDSSYFSDSSEQYINKEIKTPKYIKCPATDKVQLYDHKKHHSNVYDQPAGVVEKIHTWDEPSAMDLAQVIERAQTAETRVLEDRQKNAKKRGEDAVLREKVRRDYRTLMQNLSQLTSDERKLKASKVEHYPRDTYVQEERRKILREQHKTKLNRALKTLLDDESLNVCEEQRAYPVERPITLAPRERNKNMDDYADWEGPCCCLSQPTEPRKTSQNKCEEDGASHEEDGASREEQILDMLKKVERQKRLLLQEFGADLPNDIFNASVKSLFERDKSVQTQLPAQDVQEPLSPEIKVINASFDEKNKKDKAKERNDTPAKKVEIAVQTATEDKVQDKGTQVELAPRKESVTDDVETIAKHYPIEPKITIIRQEEDSSESRSSETMNEVTDDEESPEVTLKKKKYVTKTKMCHKSCLTRPCKPSSPTKKYPKFFPKKNACTEDVPPSKEVETCTDKKPPPVAEIAIDVSTQSTQVYSTGTQEQSATSKQQWTQSRSRRIQIKDISDTSTSFASPPPVKPKDILEALSNNLTILELLDSPVSETIRRLRRDVSPVSTPETPSPRTMRMPSNIPDLERIKKLLRYSSIDVQTDNNNTSSSTRNDYSTSIDTSQCQQTDHPLSRRNNDLHSKVPPSLGFCICNNPECEQMHAKFDEIRSYALKNCPQILQKYEDLQTICAERIISLTNLIEKVRNEQRGMELSMIDSHDETSLMQLPEPRLKTADLENVHRLIENIEAIHNQLARTLIESQKIIRSKAIPREESDQVKETEIATPTIDDNAIYSTEQRIEEVKREKAKPKIINEEKVNIQLSKFRVKPPEFTSTPKHDTDLTRYYEEGLIERISKEILEQSKGLNNNFITSKDISSIKHSIQTSTDNNDFKNISKIEMTGTTTTRQPNKEAKRTKDFVPSLTDASKVSKAVDNSMHSNGRSKPPVSLLSGPYRPEIESSGHELSTIIEFDTPDTVNKSQSNVKSPLSARKVAEKSTAIVKPSEHVSPSLNLRNKQQSERLRNSSAARSPLKELVKETSIFLDSPKTSKNIGGQSSTGSKEEEGKKEEAVQETSDKKLQCDTDNRGSPETEEQQLFRPDADTSKECKDNGDKITSTSSNSFSELSGVSQIASTPSSTVLKYASSPEEMEIALKKLGLGWAITTLKKTREASALSSSSNSDVTPMNTAKRISPVKKQLDGNYGLPDFSDVSSISIKEASKSTEQAVLLKGRTSTPKLQDSNSNSERTNTSNTNVSENFQKPDDGLIIPNISLMKTKSSIKRLENPR